MCHFPQYTRYNARCQKMRGLYEGFHTISKYHLFLNITRRKPAMAEYCVFCDTLVRPRQEALQCDLCSRWQHRTCDSGISLQEYKTLLRTEDFQWCCSNCSRPEENEPQDAYDIVENAATFNVLLASVPSTGGDTSNARNDATFNVSLASVPSTAANTSNAGNAATFNVSLASVPLNAESILEPDAQEDMDVSQSFDVSGVMDAGEPIEESDMEDPLPTDTILEDHEVRYEIVESGTKRGGKKLVSSEGFSYTIRLLVRVRPCGDAA